MKLKEIETITRSIAWGASKILHSYYCGKNRFETSYIIFDELARRIVELINKG